MPKRPFLASLATIVAALVGAGGGGVDDTDHPRAGPRGN
jgi:hypothetical protein